MTGLLTWIGARARWGLIAGIVLALAFPSLAALAQPVLPLLVSLVLGLAIARVDFSVIAKHLTSPKRWLMVLALTLLIMPLMAGLLTALASLFGVSQDYRVLLLIYAASPPIASAAALCFIMGFDAILALEVTLVATALTPLLGPLIFSTLTSTDLGVTPLGLSIRLAQMIAGGFAIGISLRALLGRRWITQNPLAFDGIATLGMGAFVLPLFDGFAQLVSASPTRAAKIFGFCLLINLGIGFATYLATRRWLAHEISGAVGLFTGNRTVAIYAAALPADPILILFVALYQFPMYLTPLLWSLLRRR